LSGAKERVGISIGLLALRLGAGGLLFYGHGWDKLVHYSERVAGFADPIGLGPAASLALVTFAEVLCASLVMVGLLTRLSLVPLLIFFAVAGFIQHAQDPWPRRELAFIFAVPFLALLFTGPGAFSLDAALARIRAGRQEDPRP
jgi:putative oxidoreductase